ncbi:MAG: DUF2309 domain-containing protein [Planctomycetaceae bacterium]|nr:DUF2309 domain-containing protein [Planctomycetaceae bacterium]
MTKNSGSTEVTETEVIATAVSMETRIHQAVVDGAGYLPSQGPITGFTFLNPLEHLESQSFEEVLRQVPELFQCEPYLPEDTYRRMLRQGRIREADLLTALRKDLGAAADEKPGDLVSRLEFRLSILKNSLQSANDQELAWLMAESDLLECFRPQVSEGAANRMLSETRQWSAGRSVADSSDLNDMSSWIQAAHATPHVWERICLNLMWRYCRDAVRQLPLVRSQCAGSARIRHSELLLDVTGVDADELVNQVLVRHCAAYLDQGFAQWRLPERDSGFLQSFIRFYETMPVHDRKWLRSLPSELRRLQSSCAEPAAWIADSLRLLGVAESEEADYIRAALLSLRGWAGMIWQTEVRPDRVSLPSPPGTLEEFVAVRLLLDRLAVAHCARRQLRWTGPMSELRDELRSRLPSSDSNCGDQYAYSLFQCAQFFGWGPQTLASLQKSQWKELVQDHADFSGLERRRMFHEAFERGYAQNALDAISARVSRPPVQPAQPVLQVTTCIDAREESFRRYLEESAPEEVETFGAAGFFGIPMYYRGIADAHFAALCPIIVMPRFWLVEEPVYSMEEVARAKAKARRILGTATHRILEETQSSLGGAFLSALLGPLATAPIVGYTLFPGLTARLRRAARHFVAPPQVTRLRLERPENESPGPRDEQIGFTVSEMAQLGGKLLRDIGLTANFAPIVLFLGHGSECLNNPHTSAYHCGACSGGAGGPNARAAAAMLNDPRVRQILAEQGICIPPETHFLGGQHNTTGDEITLFDLELLPSWHVRRMGQVRDILSRACELNALERCRRFETADPDLTAGQALSHVQQRSNDLSETRPEYGNCTNAMCFVGRRSRIRGLFLDRRSFLMSYDPTTDAADSSVLLGTLSAVIPVCEGINLLYTFSAIDSSGWGAGSKLPHNVTSMLGVMDGAGSDLRPGLPWQGVDIHEPMRLLFVIETTEAAMLSIMSRNPVIDRICRGGWAQLALLDPNSNRLSRYSDGRFIPHEPQETAFPVVKRSANWFTGSRDHLAFAMVEEEGRTVFSGPGAQI